jgi:hypothetical protein
VKFSVPAGVRKVELVATITGHGFGAGRDNCAEFCDHTHHFTLNGREFVRSQPHVGETDGCVAQVPAGVVPNQYGTWPFGRGGWCPGLDVAPWVVDVTDALVPGRKRDHLSRPLQGGRLRAGAPRPAGRGLLGPHPAQLAARLLALSLGRARARECPPP